MSIIYHFTSIANLIDLLNDNSLKPTYHSSFNESFISFTRNYNLPWGRVRLAVDISKLKHRYKVKPFHHFNTVHKVDYRTEPNMYWVGVRRNIIINQCEEKLISTKAIPIDNLLVRVDLIYDFDKFFTIDNSELDYELWDDAIILLEDLNINYQKTMSFRPLKK